MADRRIVVNLTGDWETFYRKLAEAEAEIDADDA